MNGNSKSQSAILEIFSWFFIINSFREVRRRRQQEKNALEAKVQEMKKKDVEAEEWKRQKQFFYEKFWTFGLGLSMLVVAGSYYWMRGWIHKYHHHPLHTFLNKKMNYLTLEKRAKIPTFNYVLWFLKKNRRIFSTPPPPGLSSLFPFQSKSQ